MQKKIAYAVFSTTDSGAEYMVKGNFGANQQGCEQWIKDNDIILPVLSGDPQRTAPMYPNGLFVKRIEY